MIRVIVRVHPVHLANADLSAGLLPTPRPSQLTGAVSLPIIGSYRIHHCHLFLLLSTCADTHFTMPQKVEG